MGVLHAWVHECAKCICALCLRMCARVIKVQKGVECVAGCSVSVWSRLCGCWASCVCKSVCSPPQPSLTRQTNSSLTNQPSHGKTFQSSVLHCVLHTELNRTLIIIVGLSTVYGSTNLWGRGALWVIVGLSTEVTHKVINTCSTVYL